MGSWTGPRVQLTARLSIAEWSYRAKYRVVWKDSSDSLELCLRVFLHTVDRAVEEHS